ncbi:MAG: penicillin-binding protein 2 [Candidatus Wildermuthbacteria bacterium]|nr:penicillin-binding protein 2 [Candidatus Wildermuthbacteria bacterium]
MKGWRSIFLLGILVLFGSALLGRLIFLQIIDHGFYLALAQGQRNIGSTTKGERGDIYAQDKDGRLYVLATNHELPFAYAIPSNIQDIKATSAQLAEILALDAQEIENNIFRGENFVVLKKNLSSEEEQKIKNANLKGIELGTEIKRYYPYGAFASHVTGFVNQDGQGQYGIEEYYDAVLGGKEGIKTVFRTPAGYLFSLFSNTAEDGSDIVLTIDPNVQAFAESLLEQATETLHITGGTVLVLEPNTGKIRALANTPEFDPNEYSKVKDFSFFQNSTHQRIYEPGSVFKPVTMAAAIDMGKLTPQTTYIDTGTVQIGDKEISNYDNRVWNTRTMTEVLEYSINTGAVFAQQQLGGKNFLNYLKRFGIFKETGIDLVAEIFSQNKELKKGYEITLATASFGQGVELTPLQLARAYGVFANEGKPMKPFIGERLIAPDGQAKSLVPDQSKEAQVISSKTASQISAMLTSVTENGYGKAARVPGYYIAGKTGTAQVSWAALGIPKKGYSDQTIQSFVGYAPAFEPRFLILVKLDNPQAKTAEYSAVPLFKQLAQYIIDYYEIFPDHGT